MGVLGMLQWKFPPCMILLCLLTCWNTILKHEVDASYDIHKVVFVSTLILVSRATERADYGAWSKDKNDVCVFDFKHCIETAPHNVHNQGPWLLRSICWTRSCYWSVPQCGSDIRMGLALPKKCKVKKMRHETKLFPPPGAFGPQPDTLSGAPDTKAHMLGAAIDVDINPRVFDLTTPGGFVSPDTVYSIFVHINYTICFFGWCNCWSGNHHSNFHDEQESL